MFESATRLPESPAADTELIEVLGRPLVSVSSLIAAVRRRRRVWMAAGMAGLLAALAYFVIQGPQYSATTTLLLRRPTINAQDPSRAMQTDIQLAGTRTVAGRALGQLQLLETAQQFQTQYKVSSATDDILVITAQAATPADAVRRADAVAKAFLEFRGQGVQRETQVQIAALQQQSNALQAQVGPLDDQINVATLEAGSSNAPAQATSLGNLLTRRQQVNSQIATVQQRISDVSADSGAVIANSRVIDPARPNHRSIVKTAVLDMAVGLLGASALGVGWVVIGEVISNRVRRRQDVMVALDAPVMVSVGPIDSQRRGGAHRSGRSGRSPHRQGRELTKVARHLRAVLATTDSPTPALAVVSVDSDDAAGQAAASTVDGLLGEGNDVLAIDLSASSALAGRFGVPANSVSQVEQAGRAAKLWVVSRSLAEGSSIDDWLQLHNLRGETEAVIVLASLDPADGAGHLAAVASTAVAVVTSGRSTAAALRATSQMLRVAGLRLDSAVLLDADPDDESFGVIAPEAARPPAWA